jgi:hypothetical protein
MLEHLYLFVLLVYVVFFLLSKFVFKRLWKFKKKNSRTRLGGQLAVRPKLASSARTPSLSLLSLADGWGPRVSVALLLPLAVCDQDSAESPVAESHPRKPRFPCQNAQSQAL